MGKMVVSGIVFVAVTYVLLAYSSNFSTELKTATAGYGNFAKAARGE